MAKKHTCKDHDHISKIAAQHLYFDWETIWNASDNSSLKGTRSNAHLLFTGDESWAGRNGDTVNLPQKEGEDKQNCDNEYTYKIVEPKKLYLNIRILNVDFSPIKKAQYELKIEGKKATYNGETNDKGEICIEDFPVMARKGELVVRMAADEAENSKKKDKGAVEGDVPVSWELKIGRLNPIMEKAPDKWCTSGVQQRLNNLGIDAGPVDGIRGPNTKAAVEKFQCMFKLNKDGKAGQMETQPKLVEVHDKNSYIGDPLPEQPKDISPIPASKKLETKQEDIGHVAPDYKKSDEDGAFFNSLLVRPTYRISLELGDIDTLFPWEINTKAGRLARLQVLGLFYWPLNHRVAAGTTAKSANPARLADNGAAYDFIWAYFKEKYCGGANDAVAEDELKKRLREWVVQKFTDTGHGAGGELPDAVATDVQGEPAKQAGLADGHFAKIRLPGGWCFLDAASGHDHNKDTSVAGMGMYNRKYDFEQACFTVNPFFGQIPLVAKVEMLVPSTEEWVPVPDVIVHFQLHRPYDMPDFVNDINRLNDQANRPVLRESAYSVTDPHPPNRTDRGGPAYFTHLWENYNIDSVNPQVNNCHESCGGKRKSGDQTDGSDVNDIIFKLGEVSGFSKVHDDPPANIDSQGRSKRVLDPVPTLKEVEASDHPHAVKAETNDDGEAGVIFMPSRCAGDCYRIRAFLAPSAGGPGSDGKGARAVRVDTGTFVIWRNMRISRWVRQQLTEANLNKVMVNQHYARADNHKIGPNDRKKWMRQFFAVDAAGNWQGLANYDMQTISTGAVGTQFDGFRAAMARAFCEFEEEPGFAVENLTQAEWNVGVLCGLEDAKQVGLATGPHGLPLYVRANFTANRLDRFFFQEAGNTDNVTSSSGFCIPALTAAAFDARTGTTLLTGVNHAANREWAGLIITRYLVSGFMRHVAKNGYLPGLTIVQSVMASNLGKEAGFNLGYSGIARHYRGAFIFYGKDAYPENIGDAAPLSYSFTANTTHEMGHLLFSVHAPGNNTHNSCASGVRTEWHDCHGLLVNNANNITNATFPAGHSSAGEPRGNPAYGTCLMSYRRCEGQFCSRCLFQLRGWDTRSAQMRAGDVNLPPFIESVKSQWVQEGQQLTLDLTGHDMHGRTLSYAMITPPSGSNLTDNGNGTARFTWTPAAGTAGPQAITFQVTEAVGGVPLQSAKTNTCVAHIMVLSAG